MGIYKRKQESKKTRTRPKKRLRKQDNKNSTKKAIKKIRKNFLFFLIIFLVAFLVESVFSFVFLISYPMFDAVICKMLDSYFTNSVQSCVLFAVVKTVLLFATIAISNH